MLMSHVSMSDDFVYRSEHFPLAQKTESVQRPNENDKESQEALEITRSLKIYAILQELYLETRGCSAPQHSCNRNG
jgi:hypothetical protein